MLRVGLFIIKLYANLFYTYKMSKWLGSIAKNSINTSNTTKAPVAPQHTYNEDDMSVVFLLILFKSLSSFVVRADVFLLLHALNAREII